MTTARQLFKSACDEAVASQELRGVSVEKILNRLDIEMVLMMRRALAQQFVLLMRDAAEGIDVNRPGPTFGERIRRMENMRTVSDD